MTFANLTIVEMLRKGFEYDYWASMRWYNALQLMKKQDTASPVLQHILTTQRVWLGRCGVDIEPIPRAATRTAFELASKAWQEVLASTPLDKKIAYQDRRGRDQVREVGEIAWHVLNHSTFHRGQLRGLAQAEGFEEFADTDIVLFLDDARKG
jgi:uncharacterized damage-inducible protein DinB